MREVLSAIHAIDLKQPGIVLMNILLFDFEIFPACLIPIVSIMADNIVELEPHII